MIEHASSGSCIFFNNCLLNILIILSIFKYNKVKKEGYVRQVEFMIFKLLANILINSQSYFIFSLKILAQQQRIYMVVALQILHFSTTCMSLFWDNCCWEQEELLCIPWEQPLLMTLCPSTNLLSI